MKQESLVEEDGLNVICGTSVHSNTCVYYRFLSEI